MSKRRLKINLLTDAANALAPQVYELRVQQVPTPFQLPDAVQNQIKFLLFLASPSEANVTHMGANYQAPPVSYQASTAVPYLRWRVL